VVELGEVILGKANGRLNDVITIFDTTGMGIQDPILSKKIYEKAKKLNKGLEYNFLL